MIAVAKRARRSWSLAPAFAGWQETISERNAVRLLAHFGESYRVSRKLALGLAGWRNGLAHKLSGGGMSRAALYFTHQQLSRGLVSWVESWRAIARNRQAVRKGLFHMLHRGVSHGLNSWRQMVAERAATLLLLRRGLSLMLNRDL